MVIDMTEQLMTLKDLTDSDQYSNTDNISREELCAEARKWLKHINNKDVDEYHKLVKLAKLIGVDANQCCDYGDHYCLSAEGMKICLIAFITHFFNIEDK